MIHPQAMVIYKVCKIWKKPKNKIKDKVQMISKIGFFLKQKECMVLYFFMC